MAELRTGAGSYEYKAPSLPEQAPLDPIGDLQRTSEALNRVSVDTEAQRTRDRLLDHYLPGLVRGDIRPNAKELDSAMAHTRKLLKQGSMSGDQRGKLEAGVNQLETLSNAMKTFMKGKASYGDVGAAINNVQVGLRAAGLLPNASRNPFNREAAKVPSNYASRDFLLESRKWPPPHWVLESNNNRDITVVKALDTAAEAYRQAPTPQTWKAFEQSRNQLNKYFNEGRFLSVPMANQAPGRHNGKVIQARIVWANQQIGAHYLNEDKGELDRLAQVYFENPSEQNGQALLKQIACVSDLAIKAGQDPLGYIGGARSIMESAKPVESNLKDPRDKTGRAEAAYVGAAYPDAGQYGLKQQTRIVEVKRGGGRSASVSYVAKGLFLTDAQGVQRGTPADPLDTALDWCEDQRASHCHGASPLQKRRLRLPQSRSHHWLGGTGRARAYALVRRGHASGRVQAPVRDRQSCNRRRTHHVHGWGRQRQDPRGD